MSAKAPLLPRLSALVAVLTACGIRGEQAARRFVGMRTAASASDLMWHVGGAGSSLVLLNGIGASGRVWPGEWIRELERSHRVVRVDARGTGGSRSAPAPFTIAELAADVVTVLDAVDIDRATVLGFSMGGIVAQELALRCPERVDRLVLVSTIPSTPAHVQATDYRPLVGSAFHALRTRGTATAIAARFYLGTGSRRFEPDPPVVDELIAQLAVEPTSVLDVIQHARAIVAWDGPDRLAGIDVPTTIVAGRDDPIVPIANAHRLATLISSSAYVELSDVGHMVPWEAGETLLRILRG